MMTGHLHLASMRPDDNCVGDEATSPIRVVLAGSHTGMRASLRLLLADEPDIEVIGEARDLEETLREAVGHRPDVLVFDLTGAGQSRPEKIAQLRERSPNTQVVALTGRDSPAFVRSALAAGAVGYVLTDRAEQDLATAIATAARLEEYLSPPVAVALREYQRSLTNYALSAREVEVLCLIALGYTTVETARRLRISPRTVETHRAHIQEKLMLRTRAELVRYALRRGLLRA
jgi:two-component system response regulator NreC